MSKSGHWNSVTQIDSNMFANCPYQVSNDFEWEYDQNPESWRSKDHYDWVGIGIRSRGQKIQNPEIESFYRESINQTIYADTDTVDDFYVDKEIVLGAVIERGGSNTTGWSIVVRTVIRWEERRLQRTIRVWNTPNIVNNNRKPQDIKTWEANHDTTLETNRQLHSQRRRQFRRAKRNR